MYELAASLGFIPTVRQVREAGQGPHATSVAFGRPVKDAWVVTFTPDRQVFGISRKQQMLAPALAHPRRATTKQRYIVAVEPVASVPVRCITVDSPTHLYLAGRSFVATHNCRDNFSARMSTGRLSPAGAQMMYDTPHIGTTVPLNVRGRATMIGVDDVPREVQVYYTPDPRRAVDAADLDLLNRLRPAKATHDRRRVQLGDADEARAAQAAAELDSGKKPKKAPALSDEWLEVLTATLVPYDDASDAEATEDDALVVDLEDDQEQVAGYGQPESVRARWLQPGMLLRQDDDWVCVTAVDVAGPADEELQLAAWRDDDDNEGVAEIGAREVVEVRRPTGN